MKPVPVHPEGPRYTRSLVFVPGLWTTARAMMPLASFLAHRGWQGLIVDAEGRGGVEARSRDVARLVEAIATPPVLVTHDAGAAVAFETARRALVSGVVWLAPMGDRRAEVLRRVGPWHLARSLLTGRDLPRPATSLDPVLFGDLAPSTLARSEAAAFVRDALRRRTARVPQGVPLMVLGPGRLGDGGGLPPGADTEALAVPGPNLLGPSAWQRSAGALHRWLVRRLGAENLELYDEAMADRDDPDG